MTTILYNRIRRQIPDIVPFLFVKLVYLTLAFTYFFVLLQAQMPVYVGAPPLVVSAPPVLSSRLQAIGRGSTTDGTLMEQR